MKIARSSTVLKHTYFLKTLLKKIIFTQGMNIRKGFKNKTYSCRKNPKSVRFCHTISQNTSDTVSIPIETLPTLK